MHKDMLECVEFLRLIIAPEKDFVIKFLKS